MCEDDRWSMIGRERGLQRGPETETLFLGIGQDKIGVWHMTRTCARKSPEPEGLTGDLSLVAHAVRQFNVQRELRSTRGVGRGLRSGQSVVATRRSWTSPSRHWHWTCVNGHPFLKFLRFYSINSLT